MKPILPCGNAGTTHAIVKRERDVYVVYLSDALKVADAWDLLQVSRHKTKRAATEAVRALRAAIRVAERSE